MLDHGKYKVPQGRPRNRCEVMLEASCIKTLTAEM